LSLSKFVLLGFEDSSRNCSPESPSNTDSAWRLYSRWLLWCSLPEQVGFVTWPSLCLFLECFVRFYLYSFIVFLTGNFPGCRPCIISCHESRRIENCICFR
jgi:hypothetical protein